MSDYKKDVEAERRESAQVVQATYALASDDINAVEEILGSECLKDENPAVTLHKGYSNEVEFDGLNVDDKAALTHLVTAAGLPQPLTVKLLDQETAEAMVDALADAEQTEAVQKLQPMLQKISESDAGVSYVVYNDILDDRIPKFLYFDEYYQMKGQDSLEALRQRVESSGLEGPDYPLLGLIDLAGLDLNQLAAPGRTEALLANLEAAENQLTQKVLNYWSQNRHLRMKFDIRPAQPKDPAGMTNGMNIWGRVHDTKHMVSTALGTRSRGFVWFFSFLAWYSQLRKKNENLILLLDEPGLSLHAKAQADLLRYFEEELKPHHQLIYTTHSPFMVNPRHFERVRIVQDLSIELDSDNLPEDRQGTQVITEVLDATPDSLFPLQGALGYEITQTLFIGPNCLIVEGPSDLRYIPTVSALLQERGKAGLSADWTITQVGGSGKISTFVALIGAQKDLKIAVLIDYQKNDQQSIEYLYKMKLLEKKGIFTYAQFTGFFRVSSGRVRLGGSLAGCKTGSYTARFWASKVPGKSCEWSCAEPTAKSTSSSNTTSKSAGRAANAAPCAHSTIISPNAAGVTSTPVSTARSCTPGRRAATAPSTGRASCDCPGPRLPAASPRCLKLSRSRG